MPHTDFSFYLDVITSYISFGLALYATGSLIALIRLRRPSSAYNFIRPSRDLSRAYLCVITLILLEASQQVWDSFHDQHFPLWIVRMTLPCLYLVLGNSSFRAAGQRFSDSWTIVNVEASVKAASHGAQI